MAEAFLVRPSKTKKDLKREEEEFEKEATKRK